jgi:hypothetical protein
MGALLKPLTAKGKDNKCLHKKCKCGHCSSYHYSGREECLKISLDLMRCPCKSFRNSEG